VCFSHRRAEFDENDGNHVAEYIVRRAISIFWQKRLKLECEILPPTILRKYRELA